jgi:hypothetical protein
MRRGIEWLAACAVLVFASVAGAQTKPSDFAHQESLTPQPNASIQRLALPARVLARLQSTDANDLRVFNAQGQALATALHAPAPPQAEREQKRLSAYPIVGANPASTAAPGVSLRIEQGATTRVIQVDAAGAPVAADGTQILAALIDTRSLVGSVVAVDLEADFPANTPVAFSLYTSRDLRDWQPLADAVVFRSDDATLAVPARVELGGRSLAGQYLRVSWQAKGIAVRGASLVTERAGERVPRAVASLGAVPMGSHTLSFALPFATPIAALRITPVGDSALVPLRIFGRQESTLAWLPIASGVVYRLNTDGKLQSNDFIDVGGASVRELMIVADAKTPGFTAPPEIKVEFEPLQLVFVASGAGPFTLAAGLKAAPSAHLPIQSLIPGYSRGAEDKLPFAQLQDAANAVAVSPPSAAVPTVVAPAGDPKHRWILWGVLLLGVAALGGMVWMLSKQLKKP